MARKSKVEILREKLVSISKCPNDIFDAVGEEVLPLLERCERGDISSIEYLCTLLYGSLDNNKRLSSLVYFLTIGVRGGSRICAEIAVKYIARTELLSELAIASLALLRGELDRDGERVTAMLAIGQKLDCLKHLSLLPRENYADVWLYVLWREDLLTEAEVNALCAIMGLTPLSTMGDGYKVTADICRLNLLTEIALKYPDRKWYSFWLKHLYEYACNAGALSSLAALLVGTLDGWSVSPRGLLYSYAAAKIASQNSDDYLKIADKLYRDCVFYGIAPDGLDCEELVREGVYLDLEAEIQRAEDRARLGGIIEHIKNRYSISSELTGRDKRARMHHWTAVLSIAAAETPKFSAITIEQVRHRAQRHSATLEHNPARCQIICRSEICLAEKWHPFEIDFYIDLPFVCATKCKEAELRVFEVGRNGEYLSLHCDLFLK